MTSRTIYLLSGVFVACSDTLSAPRTGKLKIAHILIHLHESVCPQPAHPGSDGEWLVPIKPRSAPHCKHFRDNFGRRETTMRASRMCQGRAITRRIGG
jgi:hypothetical protein